MTLDNSDLALPQTLPEIFDAAAEGKVSPWYSPGGEGQQGPPRRLISTLGQEMPPDLSPKCTPPSEEDFTEAERLKTEGERKWELL